MKIQFNILKLLFLISMGLILFNSCDSDDCPDPPPIPEDHIDNSLFETDAGGWVITGDAQGGYTDASYSPDGGVKDGYIYANDDVTGGVWYFTSPSSYHGNKNAYYGATLKFSLFQDSNMSDQFESADVIFKNGNQQITYVHNPTDYPTSEWTHYTINISEGNGWLKGDFDSGVDATGADILDVLSNITEFSIRGEFERGPDNGGMDNVKIYID